jgi:hypothetical protein
MKPIPATLANIKFHENPFSDSGAVSYMQAEKPKGACACLQPLAANAPKTAILHERGEISWQHRRATQDTVTHTFCTVVTSKCVEAHQNLKCCAKSETLI